MAIQQLASVKLMVTDVDSSVENLYFHGGGLANKRSVTPNGIPSFLYTECGHNVCVELLVIFRRSLEEATVTDLIRCAVACPFFKKERRRRRFPQQKTANACVGVLQTVQLNQN